MCMHALKSLSVSSIQCEDRATLNVVLFFNVLQMKNSHLWHSCGYSVYNVYCTNMYAMPQHLTESPLLSKEGK